ncbi:hypothetical protein SLE2022_099650 [Rubroshorea leprosula]
MEDQRQLFRSRLPWLSAAMTPLLATEPDQAPAQPATNISVQRPPSRPLWIATLRPSLFQAQETSPKTETQATAPSRAAGETRATSQLAAPSEPTTQTRDVLMPPSPSRGATESSVAHDSVMTEAVSKPPSSPKQLPTTKEESLQPPPSASLEEQTAAAPQQPSVEAQPKSESSSQEETPTETAIQQPPAITAQPPQTSVPLEEQKLAAPQQPLVEAQPKSESTSQEETPTQTAIQQPPAITAQPPQISVSLEAPQQPSVEAQPKSESTSQKETPTETAIQQPPAITAQPPQTSASLEEQKLAAPQPPSVEAQPKSESSSQEETPTETAIQQPPAITAQPPQASIQVTETASNLTEAAETHAGSSESNKREDGMKVEEQTQEREPVRPSLEAEETQEKTQEDDTKKPWTTAITDEKEIDTDQKDGHKLDNSHQKHVPVEGERVSLQQGIIEDFSKLVQKLTAEHAKLPMGEKPGRLLTLTGENKGALMYLGIESGKRKESVHSHGRYNANPDDSPEATTDGEISYSGEQTDDSMTEEDSASNTYVNSNAQSIGNSIVLDCSVTDRNPGVHLTFCLNLSEDSEQTVPSTKSEPFETKKDEFNITPAE